MHPDHSDRSTKECNGLEFIYASIWASTVLSSSKVRFRSPMPLLGWALYSCLPQSTLIRSRMWIKVPICTVFILQIGISKQPPKFLTSSIEISSAVTIQITRDSPLRNESSKGRPETVCCVVTNNFNMDEAHEQSYILYMICEIWFHDPFRFE